MEGIEEENAGQEAKQHQENGGELSAEQLAKFSADYGTPAKSEEKEPEKEVDEEEAFVLFPEEKEEDGAGADKDKEKQPSTRDYSKFKEVLELDEDIDSDDSLSDSIKKIVGKS